MSNRKCLVTSSIFTSSGVSRSKSSVPSPCALSVAATARLRELVRLLPLPWTNTTMPVAAFGMERPPTSAVRPIGIFTRWLCSVVVVMIS